MTTPLPAVAGRPDVGFRLRWYPRLLLAAVVASFGVFLVTSSGSTATTGRVGGDYPAFYAAGRLVTDDPAALYEIPAQTRAQVDLLGVEPAEEGTSLLYFAYPPYVALVYVPLAALPYTASYALHTVAMAGLVVLALHRLRPLVPLLDRWFEQAVIASLFCYPLFRGVTAGQTTAIVLVLLAVGVRALADRHDVVAGLAFAGLLYKPQYALALLGVSLLIGRWRTVVAGAAGSVALFLVGAAVQGWGWLGPWAEQVRWFTEYDAEVNAANAVSWLGVGHALWGVEATVANVLGWALAAATAGILAWVWWRDRGEHLGALLAVTCPGILLLAPHAMYYDAGILVVSFAWLAGPGAERIRPVAVLYGLTFLQPLSSTLGVSPLFVVVVATFAWALRELPAAPVPVAPAADARVAA